MRALDLIRVDPMDEHFLSGRWRITPQGYVGVGRAGLLHRLITDAPEGTHVDHINGDRLDNRRENLRVVTPQINQVNRPRLNKNNTSGARGVTWSGRRGKWVAQICVARRMHFLGHFDDISDAVAARREAEVHFYGEECPR